MKNPVTKQYVKYEPESNDFMRLYATFFMEQHLGHQVHYENLRQFIDRSEQIHPTWVPVTYIARDSFLQRLTFLPRSIRGPLVGRQQVRQGLKVEPCDVLYFNTQAPAALGNPQAKGKPYLIATDVTPIQYDRLADHYGHHIDSNNLLRQYKHRVNTHVFRGAARLLPWSSWTAKSLIQDYGVDPQRVEVMPVGVDLDRWCPTGRVHHERVRILFVGGDFERKGGTLLLEAFRSLPAGSAELILVTHSAVLPEKSVIVHNNIQPNSAELLDLYRSSDIFVLPSNAEAFGIAAVEASASGLPVIAAATGGLSDIVVNEETGFLIPAGDVRALSTHLRILVENVELRRKMGGAAHQRAQCRFDAKKNAARLTVILSEIVSK